MDAKSLTLLGVMVFGIGTIGSAIFTASKYDRVCAQTESRRLPLYAPGPKHHIKGPQIGWVDDDICIKWVDVEKETKKEVPGWPDPVY